MLTFGDNNRSLSQTKKLFGSVYGGTQRGRGRDMWVFGEIDFVKVAEAMGCLGLRVEQPNELRPALDSAFAANHSAGYCCSYRSSGNTPAATAAPRAAPTTTCAGL